MYSLVLAPPPPKLEDTLDRQLSLQYTGNPLSSAGDVNNDGYDDILVGSPAAGTLSQGHTYLVFGGADLPASIDLESEITGDNGVVFKGALTGEFRLPKCCRALFTFAHFRLHHHSLREKRPAQTSCYGAEKTNI